MSTYTASLKEICDAGLGLKYPSQYSQIQDVLNYGVNHFFERYPIFDENYRETLNKTIVGHYLNHEIGFETYALWKFNLNQRLMEIMPYYNQLYKTTLYEIDPFSNMDYTVDHDGESHDTEKLNQSVNDKNKRDVEENNTSSGWSNHNNSFTDKYKSEKTSTSDTDSTDTNDLHDNTVNSGTDTSTTTYNTTNTDTKNNVKTTDEYKNLATTESGSIIHNYDSGTKNETRTIFSDTPQGILQNPDSIEFATNVTNVTESSRKTGKDTDTYNNKKNTQNGVIEHTTSGSETNAKTGDDKTSTVHGHEIKTDKTGTLKNVTKTGVESHDNDTRESASRDTNADGRKDTKKTSDSYSGDSKSTSDNKKDNQNKYLDKYKGRNGITMAEALKQYRDILINIDLMIIKDLRDLFMLIY